MPEGNPEHIAGLAAGLCGKKVAAETGTTVTDFLQAQDRGARQPARTAIKMQPFLRDADAFGQLALGHVDAYGTTTETGGYRSRHAASVPVRRQTVRPDPLGIATARTTSRCTRRSRGVPGHAAGRDLPQDLCQVGLVLTSSSRDVNYCATFDWSSSSITLFHPSHAFVVGLRADGLHLRSSPRSWESRSDWSLELARRSRRMRHPRRRAHLVWICGARRSSCRLVIVYSGLAELGLYSFPDRHVFGISCGRSSRPGSSTLGGQRGRVHGGDHACRDQLGRRGQTEAAESLGMTHGAGDAPRRAAAGDAGR